jgi:putative ABC transport system permease protein
MEAVVDGASLDAQETNLDSLDSMEAGGIPLGTSVRIALGALVANKLRSFLTALGVIIGVAAVVALLAIGKGVQEEIVESITANGANLLTVRSGAEGQGFGISTANAQPLTMEDVAALSGDTLSAVAAVSPEGMTIATITAGSNSLTTFITAGTNDFFGIHNHTFAQGSAFSVSDLERSALVAVLGSRVAERLFPEGNPLGQTIRMNGQRFRVVGVLGSKGGGALGSMDDSVILPLTTVQRRLVSERGAGGEVAISTIVVQATTAEQIEMARQQIARTLREQRGLPLNGSADDFTIDNQQDFIDTLTESSRTMTFYLGAIAMISLIVGGIGIMNTMLVSVHERTREIGLRKALGAREGDILTQFLIEALALSVGGGLLGLTLGVSIALIANQTGQARATITPASVGLAVGVAVAVGLFFGVAPARRAAALDPVVALRSE